ncbi:MFS transporter [Gordonia sp. CPCC 205333]|uniref:MFS transporter n=1 Tax=Gordonia sp. CPCC 205333 TaxID=3140790 RepID=UPI003AF3D499
MTSVNARNGRGRPNQHPGAANYPPDAPTRATRGRRPAPAEHDAAERRSPSDRNAYRTPRTHNPHLPPLDETTEQVHSTPAMPNTAKQSAAGGPKKITVTRVAAARGRELTNRGIGKIHQAVTADGADRSGLTALTLPVIANAAVDAAMTVALANTLFFAAASGESKTGVGLYLLLTIAPFALIAPLIGPLLDKLQHGRRIAMAATFGVRVILALLIISNYTWDSVSGQVSYDPWVLYPCALGLLVLSKSFGVLKSAVTPRVLPPTIDLVRVNSRLTTFGLIGGTLIGGAVAGIFELLLAKALPIHIPGALLWLAVVACAGAYLCMRIPKWVESTEGEIPTTITYHGEPAATAPRQRTGTGEGKTKLTANAIARTMRQPLGRKVVAGLWGNGTIRILTGFLTLFIAFYAKSNQSGDSSWAQLLMLGAVGGAAGVGNLIGNGVGTRLQLKNPPAIVVWATASCFAVTVLATVFGSVVVAAVAALVASGTSAIGKVCLDSSIQTDLPEESRASAFGRSETVLQLSWVLGASLGVLLPSNLKVGFGVVAVLLAIGLLQTVLTTRGSTMIPGFGGKRPDIAQPTGGIDLPPHVQRARTQAPRPPEAPHQRVAGDTPARHPGPTSAPTRAHQPGPTDLPPHRGRS